MPYAIYTRPNTKDRAINLTMVTYGNRQNSITFKLQFVASTETFNGNQALAMLFGSSRNGRLEVT